MPPEYSTKGRFPESERILLIGPRKQTFTTLTTKREPINEESQSDGHSWKGELDVDGKDIKGKVVFERNASGEKFKTERELLDFLAEKYSITYLRDKSEPAIITGG